LLLIIDRKVQQKFIITVKFCHKYFCIKCAVNSKPNALYNVLNNVLELTTSERCCTRPNQSIPGHSDIMRLRIAESMKSIRQLIYHSFSYVLDRLANISLKKCSSPSKFCISSNGTVQSLIKCL